MRRSAGQPIGWTDSGASVGQRQGEEPGRPPILRSRLSIQNSWSWTCGRAASRTISRTVPRIRLLLPARKMTRKACARNSAGSRLVRPEILQRPFQPLRQQYHSGDLPAPPIIGPPPPLHYLRGSRWHILKPLQQSLFVLPKLGNRKVDFGADATEEGWNGKVERPVRIHFSRGCPSRTRHPPCQPRVHDSSRGQPGLPSMLYATTAEKRDRHPETPQRSRLGPSYPELIDLARSPESPGSRSESMATATRALTGRLLSQLRNTSVGGCAFIGPRCRQKEWGPSILRLRALTASACASSSSVIFCDATPACFCARRNSCGVTFSRRTL